MKTATLTLLLQATGLVHIGLICAGLAMPRVVNLRAHLTQLPPFIRQLFWTYYAFIGLCLVSFGVLTFFLAGPLAEGGPTATGLCLFLAAFWTLRLIAALFVLDVKPYLQTPGRRLGYQATNIVFIILPLVYLFAAFGKRY
jgi:hypothetical protein